MKILACAITYNCADIIKFWLRHYEEFCDEIWVWDDASTDGTREILQSSAFVRLQHWPYPGSGIDEDLFLEFAYEQYPKAADRFDWVIWADPDEFIYHPFIRSMLAPCVDKFDVIAVRGYNMTGDGLPEDDGRQIWEQRTSGVMAPVYSKQIVFDPDAKIRWNRGKHGLENSDSLSISPPFLKLLHYRYLGADYTRAHNAKNYARCGLKAGDKAAAWTCAPDYDGLHKEGSPAWSEFAHSVSFNVVDAPIYEK